MPSEKSPELQKLEQSLIQYLCQKREVEERVNGGFRRVRTLSLSFDVSNPEKPCFNVQIGMFECQFNALNGLKEKGSCFNIERYIIEWYSRPSVRSEMSIVIKNNIKLKK